MINCSRSDLSYIVGFIHGDGSVYRASKNSHALSIEISKRDEDILDKIESVLNGIKINRYSRKRTTNFKSDCEFVSLQTCDKYFTNFILSTLGSTTGAKSSTVTPPEKEHWFSAKDYLRGFIDADGSLGLRGKEKKPYVSVCTASKPMRDFIIKTFNQITGRYYNPKRNARDNIYNIGASTLSAYKIVKYLYGEEDSIYLNRKYLKYTDISEWFNNNNKEA